MTAKATVRCVTVARGDAGSGCRDTLRRASLAIARGMVMGAPLVPPRIAYRANNDCLGASSFRASRALLLSRALVHANAMRWTGSA